MTASTIAPPRSDPSGPFGPSASRIDLHLHSHASGAAGNWWVQALGAGGPVLESYTAPEVARELARAAGMDFVTLTDHESIEGALAIARHPDVLVGAEISTVFPEDGTAADVLVYGLDRGMLAELQRRRPDARRLVALLREAGLPFVLAHPVFEMQGALDRPAVERRLALFPLWEVVNGSRPPDQNLLAAALAADAGDLRLLAVRHGLPAPSHRRVAGVGGSDDHAGLFPGSAHTLLPRCGSPAEVLDALREGAVQAVGAGGSPATLLATGLRLAGHAAAARPASGRESDDHGRPEVLRHLPLLSALPPAVARRAVVGRYEGRVKEVAADLSAGSWWSLAGGIGRLVEAHAMLAPLVGVHAYWGSERRKAAALRSRLAVADDRPPRVGLFVDGFGDVHGVSTFYRHLLAQSPSPGGPVLDLVRCGTDPGADLRPIAHLPIPLHDADPLPVPSFPDLLDLVVERGFDVLHVAAPGPLGVAALAAGHVAGLPVVGAYHTEFGDYAALLTGDRMVGAVVQAALKSFYDRCAVVLAPSATTAAALRERGFGPSPIEVLRNGVDAERFHPGSRNEAVRAGIGDGRVLLLYAGRVGREKGLAALADGYRRLRQRRDDVHLVVVGDGPYRGEMERALGPTASFLGFLHGEALARVVASCDLLLFPSETDTLGRVVIEAQACGVPAVVKTGGPAECLAPGLSGLVVDRGDERAFWEAVVALVDDPARRRAMGRAARGFAEGRAWSAVRSALDEMYLAVARRTPSAADRAAAPAAVPTAGGAPVLA